MALRRSVLAAPLIVLVLAAPAGGQLPVLPSPPPPPPPTTSPSPPPAPRPAPLRLSGPRLVATGIAITATGSGADRGASVVLERARGSRWVEVARTRADAGGRFGLRHRPSPLARSYRLRARAPATGALSPEITVGSRDVTLAAVGDINLGPWVAAYMRRYGLTWPWRSAAPRLRAADIAFGNLECAITSRGRRDAGQPFAFRGSPSALRVTRTYAGMDVLNLANNHAGDYGAVGFGDTVRYVRRFGMLPVGGGLNRADARTPRVITRLGLRVAFVGFNDVAPFYYAAGARKPGHVNATPAAVTTLVRRARRRADLVIATFHFGQEYQRSENGRQRFLAGLALRAGAHAVIGAHAHVLQPVRGAGPRRVIAYGLGNFIWPSNPEPRTGILHLRLSARGVERAWLKRGWIVGAQPRV
jgi:hypothetical protein